ncbi:transcriptional regulator, AraC family with amidase-like domain [Actinomadura meyerae]|uniref:Transcriptional regulator, AraC family with amidase-like domain n=1 Tax=Actinomadura meyerae TaxID=240840 RepID=A0A239HMT8_9ACTN|nr:helix-turn-helix domain-containing protein [Actinomadura meyerae]SNS82660.1 transcriptional regulator, AraC family with amidase-like domain [Actinomadura meyerae]
MHRVVALVRPNQSTFELGCAADVFGTRRPDLAPRYTFDVCAEHPGRMTTSAGYDLVVPNGLEKLDEADTVIIPGWLPVREKPSPALAEALRGAHKRGARMASICTGAFALAHTGLLDGRRATTHWARTDDLAAWFPKIQVDANVLYVNNGDVATSAGAGAGIDLCLHLLRTDQGAAYAAHVARSMVMPPHREGGQLQYAAPPHPRQVDGSLGPLLEWATRNLSEPLTVEALAAQAGVSPRTLARRFTDQLGTSPGQWLLSQRIAAAQHLLETTDLPVETVAQRTGLSSATNLRRRFRRARATTPSAYRRHFQPPNPQKGV